jgi:hypothetical protein
MKGYSFRPHKMRYSSGNARSEWASVLDGFRCHETHYVANAQKDHFKLSIIVGFAAALHNSGNASPFGCNIRGC